MYTHGTRACIYIHMYILKFYMSVVKLTKIRRTKRADAIFAKTREILYASN